MRVIKFYFTVLFVLIFGNIYAQQQYISFNIDGPSSVDTEPSRIITDNGIDGVVVEYNFNKAIIHNKTEQNDLYNYFFIKGFTQNQNIGKPMLPVHIDLFYIPEGANCNLEILDSSFITYSNFKIYPSLKQFSDNSGDIDPTFTIDSSAYTCASYYPSKIAQIKKIVKIKGLRFALIEIHPIRTKTIDGVLKLHSKIKYRLNFTNSSNYASYNNYSLDFLKRFSNIPLNNYQLKNEINYYINSIYQDKISNINYLIISHQDYKKAANDLAKWKMQLGYKTKVILGTNWNTNSIKNEIDSIYSQSKNKLDNIVLLGDIDKVPSYSINSNSSDQNYVFFDGVNDFIADANIGRISVNDSIEANSIISKIINYEKDPTNNSNYYSTVSNIADYNIAGGSNDKRRYTETAEEISKLLELKNYTVNRMYSASTTSNPSYWSNDIFSNGNSIPNNLKKPSYEWSYGSSSIVNEFNKGSFLMIYHSNGWTGGWSSPIFNKSDINYINNNNKFPLVLSLAGKSGNFSEPECFAEKLHRKANGGAIAVISNSISSYSGYNNGFCLGFIDAIWPNSNLIPNFNTTYTNTSQIPIQNEINKIGDIYSQSVLKMIEVWGSNISLIKKSIKSLNILGDPSIRLWTKSPLNIIAINNDSLSCNYDTSLIIQSNISGLATLIVDDVLVSRKTINAGIDTLFFNKIVGSSAILTISKNGYKPYISNITIIGNCIYSNFNISASSYCIADSFIINNLSNDSNNNYSWSFGLNATPNNAQGIGPFIIKYSTGGEKVIECIVTDTNNNIGTHTEQLIVDSICINSIPSNGSFINNDCNGILIDNGYFDNYTNNTFGSYTISPFGASNLSISFTELDMGNGNDRINIYDGPNTNSPLLTTLSGSILPNSAIISSSNSVTVQQISDGVENSSGFILEWNCISTVSKPIAKFYTSDTNSCNTKIKFYNLSTEAVSSYWDFGDGNYSTQQNPIHTYLHDGQYTVKLLISNSIGYDSLIKNNYVNILQLEKPIISDAIRCSEGEVELRSMDTNNTIYWFDNISNTNPLHSGNTFNTFIDTTRNFYASQKKYYSPLSIGKFDTIGNGSFAYIGSNKGLTFDVINNSNLISIDVYTMNNGERTIFLFNSANELINSKTLFLDYGKNTINLDWDLQQGIDYRIQTNAYSGLYYSTSNISFPYTDANNNIILKGDSSNSSYFYFYNWKLQNKYCISPREEIKAIVSDTLKPQSFFQINIEGPNIQLNNKSNYSNSYYWDFGDGDFSLLKNPNHTYSNNGLYEVKLIASNDCGIKSYTKNIQIVNTSIKSINNNSIKIFPNPATNIINIEFNTIFRNNVNIKLYNTLGQEIKENSVKINARNSIISINTEDIQRGIYFIIIETDNNIFSRKIVLE